MGLGVEDNPQPSRGDVAATGKSPVPGAKLCSLGVACLEGHHLG